MTVRAHKPEFNFREKLKELERPIGLKGNELMRAETAQDARDLVSAGRKNMIINGDMNISQRNTTFSSPPATANGYYTLDRFSFQASNNNYTVTRDTSAPAGFSKSLKVTMAGLLTTLDYMRLCSTIEGYTFRGAKFGTDKAEHLTLSFWVKSSLTGIFAIGFRNGTNLTTNLSHSFVTTYEINHANIWEYKTVSIPPELNGTWNTDSNLGMVIMWDLGDGPGRCPSINSSLNSTWQTADNYYPIGFDETVKLAGTADATWQITGIQLEVGRNATDFEYRPFSEELALCQRYFEVVFSNTGYYNTCLIGKANTTAQGIFGFPWKVEKRVAPTTAITGTGRLYYNGGAEATSYNFGNLNNGTTGGRFTIDSISGSPLTVGEAIHFDVNSTPPFVMTVSAEI